MDTHLGGLPELPDAWIVVSTQEWESVRRPVAADRGYLRHHLDLPGLHWHRITPEVLGDASLAPFSQSVAAVNELRKHLPGLTILAAHDPAACLLTGEEAAA